MPVMVWRVYADGRPDELVRGVDIVGTPLLSLNNIMLTGDTEQVFNGVCGAESGQVPVAAAAPAMLFSEIEVQKRAKGTSGLRFCLRPDLKLRQRRRERQSRRAEKAMSARCRQRSPVATRAATAASLSWHTAASRFASSALLPPRGAGAAKIPAPVAAAAAALRIRSVAQGHARRAGPLEAAAQNGQRSGAVLHRVPPFRCG